MSFDEDIAVDVNSVLNLADDIDDDTFLNTKNTSIGKDKPSAQEWNLFCASKSHAKLKLHPSQQIKDRVVKSSWRSLNLLRETEQVGVATVEELFHQREQLERTEKLLEGVNSTLDISKTQLQGIENVLGSMKNILLRAICGWNRSNRCTKFSENAQLPIKECPVTSSPKLKRICQKGMSDSIICNKEVGGQDILDKNLDEIMDSVVKLKGLAHGLGDEIESQNTLVENIMTGTEGINITLDEQNKDINKILNL